VSQSAGHRQSALLHSDRPDRIKSFHGDVKASRCQFGARQIDVHSLCNHSAGTVTFIKDVESGPGLPGYSDRITRNQQGGACARQVRCTSPGEFTPDSGVGVGITGRQCLIRCRGQRAQ
jgi:hypothetical protein